MVSSTMRVPRASMSAAQASSMIRMRALKCRSARAIDTGLLAADIERTGSQGCS